jgi:WD40 repeat protein
MVLPLQTEKQIWELLAQALPWLKALHDQGQVQGDIKPATSLERSPTQPLDLLDLTPFGMMGSAEYAAPEQLKGSPSAASDLYSLGMSCIYWLTGVSPFDWLDTPVAWIAYLQAPISPSLQRLLVKLTAPTIQDRYQTVAEVLQEMAQAGAAIAPLKALQSNSGVLTQIHCAQVLRSASVVHAIAIHPSGWMFAGTAEGQIQRWNLKTGELEEVLAVHSKPVTDLALCPSSTHWASSSDDRTVQLWDAEHPAAILCEHTHCIKTVAFSPDGMVIASGSWDKTIKLWPVLSEASVVTLARHRLGVNALAFCPQGQWLASGGLDSEVLIWNWRSHQLIQCLTGHTRAVTALAFSPDGLHLASGSDDGTIRIWKSLNRQFSLERTLSAHSWTVSSLTFGSTTSLFSGSWDHTIKIWDIATGEETTILRGHTDSVMAIALDESGKVLASSSHDQTIRLWEMTQF